MLSADRFVCILASSSLWLAGSGWVLWLCLRSRLRLSPNTHAVASLLIVLQGWIWFGIPIQLRIPSQFAPAWIQPKPTSIPAEKVAAIDAAKVVTPLPMDARLPLDSVPSSGSQPPFDSRPSSGPPLSVAANSTASVMRMAGASAAAIWMAGIVVLLARSIRAFVAFSRMVQALPCASVEWQNDLSALCHRQSIGSPPVLKISRRATPMLVQTWG